MHPRTRRAFFIAPLAWSVLLSGCVPIPGSRNVAKVGPIERKKPHLDSLTPGSTKLDDLRRELEDLETDASTGKFLWARWSSLNARIDWFPTVYQDTFWSTKNLVAVFDDNATLVEYRLCSDRELVRELPPILKQAGYQPPDAAAPIELRARHWSTWAIGTDYFGTLTFQQSELSFSQTSPGPQNPAVKFTIPFTGIQEITAASGTGMEAPVEERLSLRLKIDAGVAPFTTLEADASPSELALVFWRLDQAGFVLK